MSENEAVKVIPLGGMGEIGKNMYVIECMDEIIIVDAGVKFATNDLLGVDLLIPDFSYLEKNTEKIKGLFITHGHEDHIGGIPYLLKKINIPIYAGDLALGFIKSKLEEHQLLHMAKLHEISENSRVEYHHSFVTFFRTTHSIPDSFGIVIHTPLGNIVHTGDFKFDLTPTGKPSDVSRMSEIGNSGVLCLLSDSTNSEVPGFSASEQYISDNIFEVIKSQKGRIIVALFASNVYRLQQVIKASIATGRKVAVFGRSMERAISIGKELGYIKAPYGTFIGADDVNNFKKSQVTILCTGSQGEPFAALSRIAEGKHRFISVERGDTIIFSSSPIPGNILDVNKVINKLLKAGAEVIDNQLYDIHTSGHGGQEELKLMINLMKPKYLVPIHGEYRMQKMHQSLALNCKVPEENIFVLDNGEVIEISSSKASVVGSVPSGTDYVQGNNVVSIGKKVASDRKRLAENGIITIFILKDGVNMIDKPQVISRGFVYMRDAGPLMGELQNLATSLFNQLIDGTDVERQMMNLISDFIYNRLKRSPIVVIKLINIS